MNQSVRALLLFFLFFSNLSAITTLNIDSNSKIINLSHHAELLFDSEHKYDYEDFISNRELDPLFEPIVSDSVSAGYTYDVIWLRFNIKNIDTKTFSGMIEMPIPWVNFIDVYIQEDDRLSIKELGANRPFANREVNSRGFLIPIDIQASKTTTVYMKIQGTDSLVIAPYLYSEIEADNTRIKNTLFNGILMGVIAIMVIYNVLTFFYRRDYNYLRYALYLTSLFFFMGVYYGYNMQFLWSDYHEFNYIAISIIVPYSFAASILFTRCFLGTDKVFPRFDKFLLLLTYTLLLVGFINSLDRSLELTNLVVILISVNSVALIWVSVLAWKKGVQGSGYFLAAWSFSMVNAFFASQMTQGNIDYYHWFYNLYGIFLIVDITILLFALSSRNEYLKKILEDEKNDIQNKLLEKERHMIDMLNQSNKDLEVRVALEVEKNNMQKQKLFEQSRLAQMGEMISMIAHQWRQPLNAITTTSASIKMKLMLNKYDLTQEEGRKALEEYVNNSLSSIDGFVQTLSSTIDDFRNFYKPDKQVVHVSIINPMEKALNIIKTSLVNQNIEIVEDYNCKKEMPIHENELMQVMLNILNNAKDNFKERSVSLAKIIISTNEIENGVEIKICDNGGGISDENMKSIFDPYFSTKDEKSGTGLGLYMSKIIVEQHHNGLLYAKNTDEGVCFYIEIKHP